MIPISWNEMQCQITMLKEYRKVAKVQPDFINYVEPKEEKKQGDDKEMDVEVANDDMITAQF